MFLHILVPQCHVCHKKIETLSLLWVWLS